VIHSGQLDVRKAHKRFCLNFSERGLPPTPKIRPEIASSTASSTATLKPSNLVTSFPVQSNYKLGWLGLVEALSLFNEGKVKLHLESFFLVN
jgi:hypothetical protein